MRFTLLFMVLIPVAAHGFIIDVEVGRGPDVALLGGALGEERADAPERLIEFRALPAGARVVDFEIVSYEWMPAASGETGYQAEETGGAAPAEDPVFVGSGTLFGYNLMMISVEAARSGEDGPEVLKSMRLSVECEPGAPELEVLRRGETTDGMLGNALGRALGVDLSESRAWPVTQATGWITERPGLDGSAVDCVIVTGDQLAPEFERLAEWHDLMGVRTVVRTVDWIEARYPGVDTPERIRNFLREAYQKWGTVYALLGGDPSVVPIRVLEYYWLWGYTANTSDEIPVDCYYSNLDGTWDADGDGLFGEGDGANTDDMDLYADIVVGRAPVENIEDARTFVDKTMLYWRGGKPGTWYDRTVFMAQMLETAVDGAESAELILAEFPGNYEKIRLYQNYTAHEGSIPETLENCLAYMNQGAGIVSHIGHGDFFRLNLGDEMMWRWQVDSLSNDSTFFFMYMMNCASASPEVESIAKNFMHNPTGGAVALMGNQIFANPSRGLALEQAVFSLLFESDNLPLGFVTTIPRQIFAVIESRTSWWAYLNNMLYGDPCLRIWEGTPADLEVTGASTISLGDSLYGIAVESGGSALQGATVVLAGARGEYGAAVTDASGQAVVSFRPLGAGAVDLAVSRDGYLPEERSITVTGGGGRPYVSSIAIDDQDGGSYVGDGDGSVGWGERVGLGVGVTNGGSGTLAGLSGELAAISGCSLSVDIFFSGPGADPPVYVGGRGVSPASIPFGLSAGEDALGRAPRDMGEEQGCWIWLDSRGWHVRMNGDGETTRAYRCSVEVHGEVTGHRTDHLEYDDKLIAGGTYFVLAGWLSTNDFEDGFDFQSGYAGAVILHDAAETYGDVGGGEVIRYFDVEFDGGPGDGLPVWFELALEDGGANTYYEWFPVVPADGSPAVEVFTGFGGYPYDFTIGIRNAGKGGLKGLAGTVRSIEGITMVDSASSYGDLAGGAYSAGDDYRHAGFVSSPVVEVEIRDAFGRVWLDTVYERTVDAPGDVTYSVGSDFIELVWEPSQDERVDHYEVYRSGETLQSGLVGIARGHSRFVDSGLSGEEDYYYSVVARDDMGNASGETPEIRAWTGAPYLPGFPAEIRGGAWASPVAGDADHDGMKEIFVGSRGQDLAAIDISGEALYGYPYICSCEVRSAPALADLDGDGTLECVFGIGMGIEGGSGCKEIVVLNHDGTPVTPENNPGLDPGAPGWPQAAGSIIRAAPAIYDLDDDGHPEIIIGTMGKVEGYGVVYAYRYDGSPYLGTGPTFGQCDNVIWTSPCVADLDGDGRAEVLVGDLSGSVYVWKWDGGAYLPDSSLIIWDTNGAFWASPAVGDVDGDGRPEVVAVNDRGRVHVWNHDGSPAAGGDGLVAELGGSCWSDPALADFDGDGALEIAFGLGPDAGRLILLRGDGSAYGEDEVIFTSERSLEFTSPAIADIDEDGELEIICCSLDAYIYGVNADGSRARGFPRRIDGFIYASPLIDDLDMDGDMELVVAGYDARVHVWDLEAAYSDEAVPWGMYHHDMWHTGLAGFETPGDTLPPAYTLGVFQGTVVDRALDIYVAPSEYTESAPVVEIRTASGREALAVESVPMANRTYRAHYLTEAASAETIFVYSTDLSGNYSADERVLTYSELVGGELVAVSPDGVLEVNSGMAGRAPVTGILPVDLGHLEFERDEAPVAGQAYNVCCFGSGECDLTLRALADPGQAVYVLDGAWVQADRQFRDGEYLRVEAASPGIYALGATGNRVPGRLSINVAGPNPFAVECRVSLAGAPDAHVRLRIFDVRGRLVSQLYEGRLGNAGDMVWDGRDGDGRRVSSGIYFVNAETSSASVSNKVIFVR